MTTDHQPVAEVSHGQVAIDAAVADEPVQCPYCDKSDPAWRSEDLRRGKRGMEPGPGVEYHCMPAFYCAS